MTAKELLILGGTGEASALARAVLARFGEALNFTTSLAGRTRRPKPLPGRIRVGGFGGAAGLAAYLTEHEVDRLIDPPKRPLPLRSYDVVVGRGPFALAEERHRLKRHAIDVLVCKASGGAATEAKILAARELGLPVIMVQRPPPEPGDAVETVEAAVDWLAREHPFPRVERVS